MAGSSIHALKGRNRNGDTISVFWDVDDQVWAWLRRNGEPHDYKPGAPLLGGTLTLTSVGRAGALRLAEQLRNVADQFEMNARALPPDRVTT
jgi:hypothetical protein